MFRSSQLTALIFALAIAVQPLAAAGGKAYRWVDSDGNVSFGAVPPKGTQAEEVELRGGPKTSAQAAEPAADEQAGEAAEAPGKEGSTIATPGGETAEMSPDQVTAARELNAANCKISRQNLKTLDEMPARVLERDADGNVVRLDNDEIAKRRARAVENVEKFCK